MLTGERHQVGAISTGLADDGDMPGCRKPHFHAAGERRVQVRARIDQAQRVGSEQSHAMAACGMDNLLLCGGTRLAHFCETSRQDHADRCATPSKRVHGFMNQVCRNGNDGDIRSDGQRVNRCKTRQSLHFVPIRIDWKDLPLESLAQHIGNRPPPDSQRIIGGANHGNG